MIYLDNASTTKVDESLKPIIDEYLYDDYGNAGSLHPLGANSKKALIEAREATANAFGTVCENIIFTSSGSEANSLAIIGLADYLKKLKLNHIITTKYEHHSVLNSMKKMETLGFEITYLDVNNGHVDYNEFVSAVREDTGLVSIMYVNNELGTSNNIAPIYKFCKSRKIIFHSDCVQAIGTKDIKLGKTADIITISGHKIHAPKGVGCLCTLYKERMSNIIFGGQQEFGLRPGTENVAYITAFGQAIKNISECREDISQKIELVSLAFGGRLCQLCEENNMQFTSNTSSYLNTSKIISIRFDGIDAETLVLMLGECGVYVSSGAACSSHFSEPSHVLKAIGLTDEQARSTIRISFSEYNTVGEAHEAAQILFECVRNLKMEEI